MPPQITNYDALYNAFLSSPDSVGYKPAVTTLRETEYPQLKDIIYLDHAGTTIPSASLLSRFAADLSTNLYGNPHSRSLSASLTAQRIDNLRFHILQLYGADPELWDVVFTANATAGGKLVAEGFCGASEKEGGWRYVYHGESHTSLVGIRELADERRCCKGDKDVEEWLSMDQDEGDERLELFSFPAQSNFTGRRMGRDWTSRVRARKRNTYTLLDAASYVSTTALDLSDTSRSPDYVLLSFYKIFGFPDLGAVLVQRGAAADVLLRRRYFGGGTVDAVVSSEEPFFHAKRADSPHAALEDGTLPFHNLIALEHAVGRWGELFGGYRRVSAHTIALAGWLYARLAGLKHRTGVPLVRLYSDIPSYLTQGPILSFNVTKPDGSLVSHADVERLASVKDIHIRTGGLCNPGGIEATFGLTPQDIHRNYKQGYKCWGGATLAGGKPTGAVRVSLGAMSDFADVARFAEFVEREYLDRQVGMGSWGSRGKVNGTKSMANGLAGIDALYGPMPVYNPPPAPQRDIHIAALTIYPIKSCGAFAIPGDTTWPLTTSGLLHDRAFAVLHAGTFRAVTVKECPRLADMQPELNLDRGVLTVRTPEGGEIQVPLEEDEDADGRDSNARVCGRETSARILRDERISRFFSDHLSTPVVLARTPRCRPGRAPNGTSDGKGKLGSMANTSALLVTSRRSLAALHSLGVEAPEDAFRANIIVDGALEPFEEDSWTGFTVEGGEGGRVKVEGRCQRCRAVGKEVFAGVVRERGGWFGVLGAVEREGEVRVGGRIVLEQ